MGLRLQPINFVHMLSIRSCSGKMKLAIVAAVFLFVIASYVLIADAKKGPQVTDIVRYNLLLMILFLL